MANYVYVTKKEVQATKKEVMQLIHKAQNEVRDKFTFSYQFIGSSSRNMVTMLENGNEGYDLDVNIRVNDEDEDYSASEIKHILMRAFNKYVNCYDYDYSEDSKRVFTIKVKDRENSRILHSVDFAVVYDCDDGRQQYIHFNKKQNTYEWQYQGKGFYQLKEKEEWITKHGLKNELNDVYLHNKNANKDSNKKSRSIYAESVSQVCRNNGY